MEISDRLSVDISLKKEGGINMQNEISWNENTYYKIYNPYSDISPLEPCDAPKMKKYRPKYDRCTNKQIAKRRKKNKNRKTHRRK